MKTLFDPQLFGNKTSKNRIVMAPMTRKRSPNGIPDSNVVNYYTRRGNGGVGLIFTEGTYIDHPSSSAIESNAYQNIPHFFGNNALKGWEKVRKSVHKTGTLIVPQLWHVGEVRKIISSKINASGIGPRQLIEKNKEVVKHMVTRDFYEVSKSFAIAAKHAKEIGFDGIAIHGAHGYLLDQFFWKEINKRTDQYGNSITNRVRFACDVINEIRNSVGKGFPIVFRFSQWKMSDYEAKIVDNPSDLKIFLSELVNAGVDYFDVSTRRFWLPAFPNNEKSLVSLTRKLSKKPSIAVGSVGLDQPHHSKHFRNKLDIDANVTNLELVIKSLNKDDFDFVAVGRAILSDHEWPQKVKENNFSSIKPFVRKDLENYF